MAIDGLDLFLMKASEKVTGLNAYEHRRIDARRCVGLKTKPDEISAILGHEMSH